jgi:hypothetical protein
MSDTIHDQIAPADAPALEPSTVEPTRDPSRDSAEDIVSGILREEAADRSRSFESELSPTAEPVEENLEEFEIISPDGSRRDLGEVLSAAKAAEQRAAVAEQQLVQTATEATVAVFREAVEMFDEETAIRAALRLRQINPEAYAAEVDEARQTELEERADEDLSYFGSQDEWESEYAELMSAPTEADTLDARVQAVSDALQRQLAEQEHARLSQELAEKENALRLETLSHELGMADPEQLADGIEKLARVQDALRDPEFALTVMGERGHALATALANIQLDRVSPDDPNFAQAVRALNFIGQHLEQRLAQRQIMGEFFGGQNASVSEALSPVDREVGFGLDARDVSAAMKLSPRGATRTADQIRQAVAGEGVDISKGYTKQGMRATIDDMADFKAQDAERRRAERAASRR